MKCDLCQFETDNRERFAGHRSAHVRRGELAKRVRNTEHMCQTCGKSFKTGPALGGHQHFHKRTLAQIVTPGARKAHIIATRGRHCQICKLTTWINRFHLNLTMLMETLTTMVKRTLGCCAPTAMHRRLRIAGRTLESFRVVNDTE